MADIQYDVGVDVKEALKGVSKLQTEFKELRGEMRKTDKASKTASSGFGSLKTAAAAAAVALAAFKGIKVAAEFETLRTTLKAVTGSTEDAAVAFKFAQDVAKGMPFDLQQVTVAYTKMTALGIAPTREALESFANTASATGKSLDQFVEAVADAVTGEFERLKEFGIKVKTEGDKLKVNFQGVEKSIGNDSASIQQYLQDIGNTQFAGAAALQMDTLTGKWSNFVDQLSTFSDEAVNSSGAMDVLKAGLDIASDAVQWLRDNMRDMALFMNADVPAAIQTMLDALGPIGDAIRSIGDGTVEELGTMAEAMNAMFNDTRHFAIAFVDTVVQQFLVLGKNWDVLTEGMDHAWSIAVDNLRVTFNSFVNDFLELWNSISQSSFGKFAGLDEMNVQLLDVTSNTESWASRMNRVNQEYDANLAVHNAAIGLWHEEVSAQNALKEVEKERAEIARQLELDEHNDALIQKQILLNEQVQIQKAAAEAEKAQNAETKKTVSEVEKLASAYRELNDPLGEIEAQEIAVREAFDQGKISLEDYNDALAQLDVRRGEASARMVEDSVVWSDGWDRALEDYVASANDAATNAERVFNTAVGGMEDALVGFVKNGKLSFSDLTNAILEDILRIQIRQTAANIFGGSGGSGSFGGFFADGGYLPTGQVGIVGERGPELITGPAQITPLDSAGGILGSTTEVTYHINAVDTDSFNRLLSSDPGYVHAVVEQGRKTYGGAR